MTDVSKDRSNDSFDYEEPMPFTEELLKEKLPEEIVFPVELNKFLRDQIRDLTAENGFLQRELEQTEGKLRSLSEKPGSTQSRTTLDTKEIDAAKVVELTKKCKELTTETEVLKIKCKTLETNLANKEAELENEKCGRKISKADTQHNTLEKIIENNHIASKSSEEQIKLLTEKLQQAQTKLYESKNTCTSLKQEINKAQKLLCCEIGENVTISGLSHQPGWRGRSEQIKLLQQKVVELQTKLSDYEGISKGSSVSMDRKNLANLRNAEKERRQQIENSARELRQAEIALETCRRKLEASKARIKVLENELNTTKGNITILNEKRSHDECLIEVLNNRLKSAETRYQDRETEIKHKEEKFERESINFRNESEAAQLQIDQLRRRLEEREVEIDKLRNGVTEEKGGGQEKTFTFENRYQNSNKNYHSPPNSIRSLGEPNEYVTLALAAEAERNRLLELITVLNRRLDKSRIDADLLAESLRNEQNKSLKFEAKLRKLETERVGIVKVDTGYRSKFNNRGMKNEESFNVEQARFKIELLEEECLALRARLDTVLQEKSADLAMYKRMLGQTKKTFQDACRGKSPTGSRTTITI